MILVPLCVVTIIAWPSWAAPAPPPPELPAADAWKGEGGRLLVRFRTGTRSGHKSRAHARARARVVREYKALRGLHEVELPSTMRRADAIAAYRADPAVESVSADGWVYALGVPNDPRFVEQWALHNTGQTGGVADADVNAPEAWDVTTGSADVVIAVIDSGIDYTHPDLAPNMWINPGEIAGNGLDDDGNGYIDDVHGIDAVTGSGDPMDDFGHGTRCAGLIAAVGNDSQGVAGVAWNARLVGCKFLDNTGRGRLSDAIECLDYVLHLHTRPVYAVPIVATSNSWGGAPYTPALEDAIEAHRQAGILLLAAAGNSAKDNDDPTVSFYPARSDEPSVVAVGASDASDLLWGLSNIGLATVELLAPGVSLLSTQRGGGYATVNGTSAATPVAAGVVALLKAQAPERDWRALRNLLLAGGQPIAAASGKTVTGRRLRAWDAGGVGSLSCNDQSVRARLQPTRATLLAVRGQSTIGLSALHVLCAEPAGQVTVSVGSGEQVALLDDGLGFDRNAGDGIYSRLWPVPGHVSPSSHALEFSTTDVVTVAVVDRYRAPTTIPFAWRAISGQDLGLSDEEAALVSLPFAVPFAHHESGLSSLWVHSNGYVSWSKSEPRGANEALPTRWFGPAVAPWWDDLDPAAAGAVVWDVVGAAPHRELVVEWRDVAHYDTGAADTLRFQVVFFEDRADVLFNYADVSAGSAAIDGGAGATIGIQAAGLAAGGVATTWSADAASVADGLSLLWRANEPPVADAGDDQGVLAGQSVMLDGSGSFDPELGAALASYAWRQTAGPPVTLAGAASAVSSFVAPAVRGELTFELMVADDEGVTSSDGVRVVVGNASPSITLALSNGPAREGSEIAVEITFADADGEPGGPYSIEWDWGDGSADNTVLAAPSSFRVGHVFGDDTGSPFVLTATVTDALGPDLLAGPDSLQAHATASVAVENEAPVIREIRLLPSEPRSGQVTLVSVTAEDAAGERDALSFSYDFDGDGVFDVESTAEPEASWVYEHAGEWQVVVVAADDDGGVASASVPVTVRAIGYPSEEACGCRGGRESPLGNWLVLVVSVFAALRRRRAWMRSPPS